MLVLDLSVTPQSWVVYPLECIAKDILINYFLIFDAYLLSFSAAEKSTQSLHFFFNYSVR